VHKIVNVVKIPDRVYKLFYSQTFAMHRQMDSHTNICKSIMTSAPNGGRGNKISKILIYVKTSGWFQHFTNSFSLFAKLYILSYKFDGLIKRVTNCFAIKVQNYAHTPVNRALQELVSLKHSITLLDCAWSNS